MMMTLLLLIGLVVPTQSAVDPDVAQSARHLLVTWRDAWERRDLRLFIACYAEDYSANGKTRDELSEQKASVFARADAIEVGITGVEVSRLGDGQIELRFSQTYRSRGYQDRGIKTLILGERSGRWLIVGESFEELAP